MACVVIISHIQFLYMRGSDSGLPIRFQNIAWTETATVFVPSRSPATLGFCPDSYWDSGL